MAGMPNLKVIVFPAPDIKIGFQPPEPLSGVLSVNVLGQPDINVTVTDQSPSEETPVLVNVTLSPEIQVFPTRHVGVIGAQVLNQPDIRVSITEPQVQSFVSGIPFFTFASSSLYAVSSSYASIANYAQNAFPYTGSAWITGSLGISGSAQFTDYLVIGPASLSGSSETLLNIGTGISGSVFFVSSSGRVGIGTTTPRTTLEVAGSIYASGDICGASDFRLKEDIYPISDPMNKLRWMTGVTFKWKNDQSPIKRQQIGFIAQDLQSVVPEVVFGSDEEGYSVSYGNITALVVEAIKELDNRLHLLEST